MWCVSCVDPQPRPEAEPAAPPEAAPEAAALPALPDGPCDEAPRAAPTAAALAGDVARPAPCLVEFLDPRGCVAGRVERRFDADGRAVREEQRVLGDAAFVHVPVTYVDPVPQDHVFTWAWDADGNEIASSRDADGDGQPDDRAESSWDDAGRPLERRVWAWDGAGWRPVERTRWTWGRGEMPLLHETVGADGRTTRIEAEEDAEGRPVERRTFVDGEAAGLETWERDAGGNLLRERREGAGGAEETAREYDAAGFEIRRTWRRWRGRAVEVAERHTLERWPDGALRRETYLRDDGDDGVAESRRVTVFDEAGRELRLEDDEGANGTVDWWREQAWDAGGRQTLFRMRVGAELRSERTARYDDAGRLLERSQFPVDPSGPPTRVAERFFYDAAGHLVGSESTDGVRRWTTRQENDAAGRPLLAESDHDGDGVVDARTRTRYDAGGRVVLREDDRDADGAVDARAEALYDRAGNVLYERVDGDADGRPERLALSSYDCFPN